jgi:hypothetical protein
MPLFPPDLTIEHDADWRRFSENGLEMIVDPMVYRSADVFFAGMRGAAAGASVGHGTSTAEKTWRALSHNIDSLISFFDVLILAPRLPIIDYGYTFESHYSDFDIRGLYDRCNEAAADPPLVSVHVMGDAHANARKAALASVAARTGADPALKASIVEELTAFEYAWKPDLSALAPRDGDSELFLTFLYGGALFGAYAQEAETAHLLQPKRSRLYLGVELGAPSASFADEAELYRELMRILEAMEELREMNVALKAMPPFLPYLLSLNPADPADLLAKAIALRQRPDVVEYRQWRNTLLVDWRTKGRIGNEVRRDLARTGESVKRNIAVGDSGCELKINAVTLVPEASVDLKRLAGWFLQELPGRRYTKLLSKLVLADIEYRKLDRAIDTLWRAA